MTVKADHVLANSLDALMQSKLSDQNNTATEEIYELIKRWLKTCADHHPCSQSHSSAPSWMPTRLVDVGLDDATPARVVASRELASKAEYLALSHCWGGLRPPMTRMATIGIFKVAIPQEYLPATFLDAFDATRRLGFRYIWVDSLCIVQDDQNDWKTESVLMSDVYGLSTLNLIAAHAQNGAEGCFSKRDVFSERPCRIPNPFRPASNDHFIVYPSRMDKIYDQQVRNSPVYKRAWILQERLLSPRSLYFGKDQIFWACGEMEACEAFPSGANYVPTRPLNITSIDKQGVQQLLNPRITLS